MVWHLTTQKPAPATPRFSFNKDVTDIVSEWGSIFLLTRSGVVHQLEELDTNTKLDLLYKKKVRLRRRPKMCVFLFFFGLREGRVQMSCV